MRSAGTRGGGKRSVRSAVFFTRSIGSLDSAFMRAPARFIAALVWLSFGAHASAQEAPSGASDAPTTDRDRARPDDFETSRTLGGGLGMRAGATGTTAAIYNPANLGLVQLYHIDATAAYILEGGSGAWSFGSIAADSSSGGRISGAISSRGLIGNGGRDYSGWDGRIAMGFTLSEAIAIGLSARYLRIKSDKRTSDGQPRAEGARGFTADATLRITPFEGLHIAGYAYNVVPTDSALAPMTFGGGVAYSYETHFTIGLDVLVDISTFEDPEAMIGLGAEYNAGGRVPLRIGYVRDQGRERNAITSSIGYQHNKVVVELSLRQELGRRNESYMQFTLRYMVR